MSKRNDRCILGPMAGCLVAVSLLAVCACAPTQADREQAERDVAARVNEDVITWKEVDERLSKLKPDEITPELRKAVLKDMAEELLLDQAVRKHGIEVGVAEVDAEYRRLAKKVGDIKATHRIVCPVPTTEEEVRKSLRKQLVAEKLFRHLAKDYWTCEQCVGLK